MVHPEMKTQNRKIFLLAKVREIMKLCDSALRDLGKFNQEKVQTELEKSKVKVGECVCGRKFYTTLPRKKYCSKRCGASARQKRYRNKPKSNMS